MYIFLTLLIANKNNNKNNDEEPGLHGLSIQLSVIWRSSHYQFNWILKNNSEYCINSQCFKLTLACVHYVGSLCAHLIHVCPVLEASSILSAFSYYVFSLYNKMERPMVRLTVHMRMRCKEGNENTYSMQRLQRKLYWPFAITPLRTGLSIEL